MGVLQAHEDLERGRDRHRAAVVERDTARHDLALATHAVAVAASKVEKHRADVVAYTSEMEQAISEREALQRRMGGTCAAEA